MTNKSYKKKGLSTRSKAWMIGVPAAVLLGVGVFSNQNKNMKQEIPIASENESEIETGAAIADLSGNISGMNHVTPLSATGAVFPALDVALPDTEPIPEFIRNGTEHSVVAEIQHRLMELGFMDNDEPTEYFGNVTESAVKVFQRQNDLAQDGIVGAETLAMILADDAKYYAAKNGDSGEDIRRIQTRLYELGYLANESDVSGEFGDETEEAVRKMQSMNALEQDGRVGVNTMNLIYSDEVKANMLAYGEKSDIVLAVQKRLFDLGYMTSTPDGMYGEDTSLAVKAFQSKNDQVVDGYIGPSTRYAILSSDAKPNGIGLGSEGEQVANIQSMLAKWGYITNDGITGYFGENTDAAVKAFQSRNGLASDGQVGAATITKLTSDNAARPAANQSTPARGSNTQNASTGKSTKTASSGYSGGGGVGTLLSVASSKIGTPYVWGGKGPGGFDCSGFVYWALNSSGVRQSYLTSSGWRNAGRYTRISNFGDLRAGDIVVVRGHVGIVAGGGQVIDASSSNGRVVQRSLSGWWANNFIVGWRIF